MPWHCIRRPAKQPAMTRRGSLVYYLASWICGGFFLTVAMFLQERFSPTGMGFRTLGGRALAIIIIDLLSRFDFLRVPLASVRLPVKASDDLASCREHLAMVSGRHDSCAADGLGSSRGIARNRRDGAARRGKPDRDLSVSRSAWNCRTSRFTCPARGCLLTSGILFLIHRAFARKTGSRKYVVLERFVGWEKNRMFSDHDSTEMLSAITSVVRGICRTYGA